MQNCKSSIATHCLVAALLVGSITATTSPAADKAVDTFDDVQIRNRVDSLIEQLGDPSYAMRIRARSELQRLGLLAFDALHDAQSNEDSEIAMAARYLVESLHVSWSTEDDSTEVRQILDQYGTLPEIERKSRMDRLAAIPNREGLAALCRLVRFETKLRLSRSAALLIMQQDPSDSVEARQRSGAIIHQSLGGNSREAAKWLITYANDIIEGDYNTLAWRTFIQAERDRVASQTTKSTDDLAVLDLYRICAVRALEHGLKSESEQLAVDSLDLVESRRQPLRDASGWALDHQMWNIVLKLLDRDSGDFKNDAWLSYAAAEALSETGRQQEGERWVDEALGLAPLDPLNDDGTSPMSADAREQATQRHVLVARELSERGRFAWAQREYRYVIERSPLDGVLAAYARWQLADLHSESLRYQLASDALRPVVERMKIDRDFRRQTEGRLMLSFDDFESRMYYDAAMAHIQADENDAAADALRAALAASPLDGDVLIAMYRLPRDEPWRRETSVAIRSALTEYERIIKTQERHAGVNQDKREISKFCNQYAWLVANTEGDFNRALAYSRRSLELTPKLASLTDTLSHCYYAVGDIDAAVRTQREAVALDPHSLPIKRQLDFFVAKQQAKQAKNDQAADVDEQIGN